MTETIKFSESFPAADESHWRALVEKALKGRDATKLNSKTEHGVPVQALYRETDWPSTNDPAGFPGFRPFVRGGAIGRDEWLPWDIRQIIHHPDPEIAHEEVLETLGNGASSVEIRIDTAGEQGVCIRRGVELTRLLDEVRLDLAPVALELVGESAGLGIELAAVLASTISAEQRSEALLAFNLDPVGAFARTGALPEDQQAILSRTGEAAQYLIEQFPRASVLRADSRVVHEAGGTEVQELAYLAACGAAYMRAAISGGVGPGDANRALLLTLAVGSNYHLETAKLRAARRLWGRISEAFDADGTARIQAVTSRRMLARRDAWTNLLRNTAACFAAGVGGGDIVTVRTFTDAMGNPAPLARRLARNTQIIAQEEVGLGKVIDAPGGAWAFERLTEDMALAAWELFQQIEREGGVIESLRTGTFQAGVGDARRARRSAVAQRKEWVTGVNDFPLLDEEVPECASVDLQRVLDRAPAPSAIEISDRSFAGLQGAVSAGVTLGEMTPSGAEGPECNPLWPIRVAAPYEELRDLADEKRKKGNEPRICLVALGPLAEHSARLTYATNFFAAGGIRAVVASGTADEVVRFYKESGCPVACLCGSDARYVADAPEVAAALRTAGAGRIYLAGRGGEAEKTFRAAGVDEFIHVGVDVIASLELAHAEMGLSAGGSKNA